MPHYCSGPNKEVVNKHSLIPARIHSKYRKQDAWRRATVSELVTTLCQVKVRLISTFFYTCILT